MRGALTEKSILEEVARTDQASLDIWIQLTLSGEGVSGEKSHRPILGRGSILTHIKLWLMMVIIFLDECYPINPPPKKEHFH